jgi:His-Xaa-Ser system radical SAM maturase HxsC
MEGPRDYSAAPSSVPHVSDIGSISHLADGDIVAIHPNGRVDTLFRISSPNNSLFVTERCNSSCLMCSQPPRAVDDIEYHHTLNCALIPLIPKNTESLGMTGGEPTLLGYRLIELLRLVAEQLPATQLEVLTNGRAFSHRLVVERISEASTSRTLYSIPLYSDYAAQHDYVVQAKNAFVQTVLGLHNLARYDCRAELRVVLHRQTYERLPALAKFIYKNLTFVEHIAFMGMEHTGYARVNDAALWMEPTEYVDQLSEAVEYLSAYGFSVSIYNLQPCLLPQSLWGYCRSAISDWKREYADECLGCDLRETCGGVFGTSRRKPIGLRAVKL